MSDKRISDAMENALNAQMMQEAEQAQVYLALGIWAETHNYDGLADFLYKHSTEERNHMFKFLEYINQRGGEAKIEAIPAPTDKPKDVTDCIDTVWKHEVQNSKAIYALTDMALAEKDWPTFNFMQYFVKEQIEEENLISDLRDKLSLATKEKTGNANLYSFDRDLNNAPQDSEIALQKTLGG